MVRKKTEGDEDQRRAAAHEARRAGEAPSEENATTGASKQRSHEPHRSSLTHEEKLEQLHEGKQGSPPPGAAQSEARARAAAQPTEHTFKGRGHPQYTEAHERVFRALADAEREHEGEAVHIQAVADSVRMPLEETRTLMHDLMTVHGLVTELQSPDSPDLGPRYETRPSS